MAVEVVTFAEFAGWFRLVANDFRVATGLGAMIKQLHVLAVADTRENFQTSSDPDGNPWAPLRHLRARGKTIGKPLLDTGVLRASISSTFTPNGFSLFTNLPYSAIHQYGGKITPRTAKFLAVPLTQEAKRYRPRAFPRKLFVFRSKRNRLFLAESSMKGRGAKATRKLELHYALMDSVTVPARQFLGFGERYKQKAARIVADYFIRRINRPMP